MLGFLVALALAAADVGAVTTAPGPRSLDNMRVMALGDSITEGFGAGCSYRTALWQMLVDAGVKGLRFVGSLPVDCAADGGPPRQASEGHLNATIEGLRINFPAWWAANPADIILLHIGTNDMAGPPAAALAALDALLATMHATIARSAKVYVAQIVPSPRYMGKVSKTIPAFNAGIPRLVARHAAGGMRIQAADMQSVPWTITQSMDDWLDDTHPERIGYAKMAAVWYRAMTGVAPPAAGEHRRP